MGIVLNRKDGVVSIDTTHLSDRESAKKLHDFGSALFRINHIAQMLDQNRPIEDFSPEIKSSFKEAIKCIEAEMPLIKTIYDR